MTELTDTEREQLHAPHLTPLNNDYQTCPICPSSYWPIAANIKAAARAEGARDMRTKIEELPDQMAAAWGGDDAWLTTGNRVADLVRCWLNEALADGGEPQ